MSVFLLFVEYEILTGKNKLFKMTTCICEKLQVCGIAVTIFNIANIIFVGLGLFLDGFYVDGTSINTNAENIKSIQDERNTVKGLFLAAFVIIVNSWFQIFMHTCSAAVKRAYKINAISGYVLIWCAFILCVAGEIYIAANDKMDMFRDEKSSAYALSIVGTITTGLSCIVGIPYIRFALQDS